ncbi:MAG: hypothetical protein QXJ20_01740 [Candidatus Aenigmatarchaeota archaeon]
MEELVNRAVEAGAKELLKKSIEYIAPAATGGLASLAITALIETGAWMINIILIYSPFVDPDIINLIFKNIYNYSHKGLT